MWSYKLQYHSHRFSPRKFDQSPRKFPPGTFDPDISESTTFNFWLKEAATFNLRPCAVPKVIVQRFGLMFQISNSFEEYTLFSEIGVHFFSNERSFFTFSPLCHAWITSPFGYLSLAFRDTRCLKKSELLHVRFLRYLQ